MGRVEGFGKVYHFIESAYGHGLDLVAPDVGIVFGHGEQPAFDVLGTSFAAPVLCALLACRLSGDADFAALGNSADPSLDPH